jgi:hypothetical protein
MDDMTMILVYIGLAVVVMVAARRSRALRRRIGWHNFGSRPRAGTGEAAIAAGFAALGTGRQAVTEGDWRVFRPSIGARLLTPLLTALLLLTMFGPEALSRERIDLPPLMAEGMILLLAYANVAMLRYRVEVSGDTLALRSTLLPTRHYDLRDLRTVEEDAVHSFRLGFADGRSVEILKTVAGAAELRQILRVRLEQNPGG